MAKEAYATDPIPTTSILGGEEAVDHLKARIGIDRMGHRVRPGLYALGSPSRSSLVFATANYTLSFDALRSGLSGRDAWILVLETEGINVWCAAGKGTFGTEELVRAVLGTDLASKVDGRTIILPQLGAPGVSAHRVREACGFKVEYGPVRAEDLPTYLDKGHCTEEMRTVRFDLKDRLVLAPVEVRNYRWSLGLLILLAALVPYYGAMALTLTLAGIFIFPAVLPFLPGEDLTLKGMVLGMGLVTPFAFHQLLIGMDAATLSAVGAEYLLLGAWLGYLGLNFTGSTPFTSRSGVRREIFTYIPRMVGMAVLGGALALASVLLHLGWI